MEIIDSATKHITNNHYYKHDGKKSLAPGELNVPEEETIFYVRSVFVAFSLLWTMLIVTNKFYKSLASYILFVPYFIFLLGFMNAADVINDEIATDIFSTSFIGVGIVISLPLLTLFNRDKPNIELNHITFLGLISILMSYFHIWCDYSRRYIVKAIRSCLETFAIDLYIFAIMIFFLQT